MGTRLGFKLFLGLLVAVPVVTLLMIFGLERNYVEQLKEEHQAALLERRRSVHKRSPLQQRQETDMRYDNPEVYNLNKKHDDISLGARNHATSISQHESQDVVKNGAPKPISQVPGPELYELLKERKVYELRMEKSMRESWWYLRSQLSSLKSQTVPSGQLDSFLAENLQSIKNQHNLMRVWYKELNSISSPDNPIHWKYWQHNISTELQSLMQRRLDHLQNPKDCNSARKLVCQVGKTCGFGCQMHHVAYCFILAYASERTLILDSNGWSYHHKGWNAVFQPVTKCSSTVSTGGRKGWTLTSQENTVNLPPIDNLSPRPPQLPMSVPRDMVDRLTSFHGFPFAWFVSQFMHYLMRPSPELEGYLKTKEELLGLNNVKGPIVGIHVRRTDKRSEARYHDLSEYMQQVEDWYELYDLAHSEGKAKRQVFIATDEPSVLKEAKDTYPHYEVYSDSGITSLASKTSTRYSAESLFGVIFDVNMLSKCDYIVCTFSSQVCRLAYELMQKYHVDASNMYYSLDDVYYFGGQQAHNIQAIQDHKASESKQNELSFRRGDLFGIAGNEKNGYSVGTSTKIKKRGLIPSYKVEEQLLVADFPTYNEVE